MSLQNAVVMNNTAVVRLHEGKMNEGVLLLRQSVAVLRDLSDPTSAAPKTNGLQEHQEQQQAPTHQDQDPTVSDHEETESKETCATAVPVAINGCLTFADEQASTLLFQQAFFIEGETFSKADHEFVCAIALYNMALAHHTTALVLQDSPDTHNSAMSIWKNKAMRLYQMAIGILDRLPAPFSYSVEVVVLAALNNTAHLFSLALEHDNVSAIAQAMDHILTRSSSHEKDDAFSFFYMNTIFFQNTRAVAPAA